MAWIILILAGLFEIGWAIGLKYTDGFTRVTPTVLTAGSMVISVVLLGLALRDLPGRQRLCGVDRHRHGRHGAARHVYLRRTGNGCAPRLHRADRCGYWRAEISGLAPLISPPLWGRKNFLGFSPC
jgi:hypothetical protein